MSSSSVAAALTTNGSGGFGPVEVPAGDYTARLAIIMVSEIRRRLN